MNNRPYKICANCVMDISDPYISFDQRGICNHCRADEKRKKNIIALERVNALNIAISKLKKKNKNKKYDCIVGLSGGVDSSYLAYWAVKVAKLRLLAVHVDGGWNSEIATSNIEKLVKSLNIDLHTHVFNWNVMRDLQLAFLRSGVANQDTPQDHAFFAALYNFACENDVKTVLSGSNLASESVLPVGWGHSAMDLDQIKDISKKFGVRSLKEFPKITFWKNYIYYPHIKGLRVLLPLDYMDYDPYKAIKILEDEVDWIYYGGKHHESRFTKFFQTYWLPERFSFDKRRAHLSSLILAGIVSRENALKQLEQKLYDFTSIELDKNFVAKKLDISVNDLEDLMKIPIKHYTDYAHDRVKMKIFNLIWMVLFGPKIFFRKILKRIIK